MFCQSHKTSDANRRHLSHVSGRSEWHLISLSVVKPCTSIPILVIAMTLMYDTCICHPKMCVDLWNVSNMSPPISSEYEMVQQLFETLSSVGQLDLQLLYIITLHTHLCLLRSNQLTTVKKM